MRMFVLGIPHTVTSIEYSCCAYDMKVYKLCHMLKSLGHEVIHLGCEGSNPDCDEHVSVTTRADLEQAYPGFDFRKEVFKFDVTDHAYLTFYGNAIKEIGRRKQKGDFLLCMFGAGHRVVADAFPDLNVVEPGIGYASGHFARWKVFESYALLHAYLGLRAVEQAGHCENYSVVIPNYFDLSQFTFAPEEKEDYFLCLGRVNLGKGVHIAIQAAKALGFPLKIAGQGSLSDVGYGGPGQEPIPPNVEFVGHADVETRRRLLSRARGQFVLSDYAEPFGGVTIEGGLSGTPVITTDWGAFPEIVLHGVTGYRCRTFGDILWAVQHIDEIKPAACRQWTEANYSMERVALMYDKFFHDVLNVSTGKGWYEPIPAGGNLDWLKKVYPA